MPDPETLPVPFDPTQSSQEIPSSETRPAITPRLSGREVVMAEVQAISQRFVQSGNPLELALLLANQKYDPKKLFIFKAAVEACAHGLTDETIKPNDFSALVGKIIKLDDTKSPEGFREYRLVLRALLSLKPVIGRKAFAAIPISTMERRLQMVDLKICTPKRAAEYIKHVAIKVLNSIKKINNQVQKHNERDPIIDSQKPTYNEFGYPIYDPSPDIEFEPSLENFDKYAFRLLSILELCNNRGSGKFSEDIMNIFRESDDGHPEALPTPLGIILLLDIHEDGQAARDFINCLPRHEASELRNRNVDEQIKQFAEWLNLSENELDE